MENNLLNICHGFIRVEYSRWEGTNQNSYFLKDDADTPWDKGCFIIQQWGADEVLKDSFWLNPVTEAELV